MLSGPEIALFLLIGVIVSLDVAGLTAVKLGTYTGNRRQVLGWAFQNALWHAGLLCIYGALTVAVSDWALPHIFERMAQYLQTIRAPVLLRDIVSEIANHIYVTFSSITIIVVWRAYTKKIVENPFAVVKEEEGAQRRLARKIMEAFGASAEIIGRQLQSMAVALDMLALAFLMRSLNLFGGPGHMASYTRVAAISGLILIAVFSVTLLTSIAFRKQFRSVLQSARQDARGARTLSDLLIILRIIEPLLIFYFLCEMMSYTVWRHMSSSSMLFVGSALLVVALIQHAGLANIRSTTEEMVESLKEQKVR